MCLKTNILGLTKMFKKWIVVAIIVGLLVAGCILETNYVNGVFDSMTTRLESFSSNIEETSTVDTAENIEFLENLHDEFHQKEKVLKALIWHTGLKDVEISLSRIITYVSENEQVEALAETHGLIDYCKHYVHDFRLSFENVF